MLVPISWLKKYVTIPVRIEDFVSGMIMSGSEVENWQTLGDGLDRVVVGRILKLERHPNADKLRVCTMDVGQDKPLSVITGAPNVFEGALVPVALIGAKLPNGLCIKESKLRGLPSYGMLCSGDELKIKDSVYPSAEVDGILILNEDYRTGTIIKQVLGLDDTIVEFKTLANRPDCLSIVGMAREVSATFRQPLTLPEMREIPGTGDVHSMLKVTVEDKIHCPRYMVRMVRNVKVAPSPKWLKDALIAVGIRPINNIVDITNYVMVEFGQPMHAFDYDGIEGHEIYVRSACEGESILLLDGKEIALKPGMLVIANRVRPTALAGIMGGEGSGIHDSTKTVVFESANFENTGIRVTARMLGIRTESSSRFEKNLDPTLPEKALQRALTLIEDLGCGEVVGGCIDICNTDLSQRTLRVSHTRVNHLLGQELTAVEMADILNRLFVPTVIEGDDLVSSVPSWRQDLCNTADIAEEIQRIHGYHTIPSILPDTGGVRGRRSPEQMNVVSLQNMMAAMGLNEGVSYSFMSPSVFDKLGLTAGDPLRNALRIMNPLGEDYSLMRTTLIPGLLQAGALNLNQKAHHIRLFEIGRTFHPFEQPVKQQPCEITRLGMMLIDSGVDFYTLKGCVEMIFRLFRIADVRFEIGGGSYLHPGRRAIATVQNKVLAELGELHPDVQEAFGIDHKVYIAEMNVDLLHCLKGEEPVFKPIPKFHPVNRDIAILVDSTVPVGDLMQTIRKSGGKTVTSVILFDVYQGHQVPEGKKSVAFSLSLLDDEKSLTDPEIEKVIADVLAALTKENGAQLRS
ncbi:MAG: phenylalanine--tRNA ligase subunit beta [Christensenellales bacterium]|jgi:phenylalanyl-tRNA synthetase beta chain